MNRAEIMDLLKLASLLARKSDRDVGNIAGDVLKLSTLGKRASSRAVRICNDSGYASDAQKRDKDRILSRAAGVVSAYNLSVSADGDPRGCCLHIHGLGAWNTIGGEEDGWGL